MKAHGLKPVDTVFESTATLIKSRNPSDQKLLDKIALRINGVISEWAPLSEVRTLMYRSGAKVRTLSIQYSSKA